MGHSGSAGGERHVQAAQVSAFHHADICSTRPIPSRAYITGRAMEDGCNCLASKSPGLESMDVLDAEYAEIL